MKTLLLVPFFTLFMMSRVMAQKLEKPVIDKITGETTLQTQEQTLANKMTWVGHYLGCNITKFRGHYLLYLHLKESTDGYYDIKKDYTATIKFTDGKLLTITSAFDRESSFIHGAYPLVAECNAVYYLDKETISALMSGKIAFVRLATTSGDFDYEISNGKAELIKKQLELITKN